MEENEQTIELIKETLDKIRPFMQREGGDITFDSYEDGIVYINIHGVCYGCAYIDDDIEQGVETIIMEEVPGVIAVRPAYQKEEIKKALAQRNEANATNNNSSNEFNGSTSTEEDTFSNNNNR